MNLHGQALGLRRALGVAVLLCGCARQLEPAPRSVQIKPCGGAVPLRFYNNLPIVDVVVGNHNRCSFHVDTGAWISIVRSGFADRMMLSIRRADDLGNQIRGAATLPPLRLSNVVLGPADAAVLADGEWLSGLDPSACGLLGIAALSRSVVAIDYENRELLFSIDERPDSEPIRAEWIDGVLVIPVRIGSLEVRAILDTGLNAGLVLPQRLESRLRFSFGPVAGNMRASLSGQSRDRVGRLAGPVRVAGESFANQIVILNSDRPILGSEIIRQLRITIDGPRRLVWFERTRVERARSLRSVGGATFAQQDGEWVVFDVIPNSEAARDGLLPGDLVVSIGGDSLKTLAQFRQEETAELVLERNGRRFRASLDMYDLVPMPAPRSKDRR